MKSFHKLSSKNFWNNAFIKFLTNFEFINSFFKKNNGIGYNIAMDKEISFLIGKRRSPFILFDIGANKGDYSIMVSKRNPKSTIYSFEPSKSTFDLLKVNVKEFTNIVPIKLAFGSEKKEMTLFYDSETSALASLYKRDLSHLGLKFDNSEVIQVSTIDEWVDENNIEPEFIKIDVEGFELSVLQGAVKTLKNVIAIQFEFGGTAIDAKTFFKDYWEFFQRINFEIYRYAPLGLIPINYYSEKQELFEYMNYLAIPFETTRNDD